MKEYIEKASAMESIIGLTIVDPAVAQYANAVYYNLQNLPAADVVEVKHGRWVKSVPGDGENYCSVCKAEQPWFYGYGYFESDYCPNCGARMDKEDEHETM